MLQQQQNATLRGNATAHQSAPCHLVRMAPCSTRSSARRRTKRFADELAKRGLTPRMDQAYAQELPDLPPKLAESA